MTVSLLERLVTRIAEEGPIPFEEFQAIALYDPEGGFFGSGKLRSVKEGDFLTSPEVSPLFGETLAVFVDQVLDDLTPSEGSVSPSRSPEGDVGGSTPEGGGGSSWSVPSASEGPVSPSGSPEGDVGGSTPEGGGGSSALIPASSEGSVSPSGSPEGDVGGSTPKGGGGSSPLVPPASGASGGGRGAVPLLVEVGAGSGSLLRPLLASLHHPVDGWAVEASPAARSALAEVLTKDRVVRSLAELPDTFEGVVIANELLDNLPVALAVRVGDTWEERWVGVEDGQLMLVRHGARPEVTAWADRFGLPCPDGGRVEVQLAATAWLRDVLGRLHRGAVLMVDYGDTAEALEHRRIDGTLRTYRGHHLGPQPLLEPGETDITVDVNFSALMAVAEEAGASVAFHRQNDFLESLGLRDTVRRLRERELDLARSSDTMGQLRARSDRTNAETLLHPRGLGDFRVLVVRA